MRILKIFLQIIAPSCDSGRILRSERANARDYGLERLVTSVLKTVRFSSRMVYPSRPHRGKDPQV